MPTSTLDLILKIVLLAMEGQPNDVRAELWRMYLQDVKEFRAWWKEVFPTITPKTLAKPRPRRVTKARRKKG